MVEASGLEPPTPTLSGWCSNLLSYASIYSICSHHPVDHCGALTCNMFRAEVRTRCIPVLAHSQQFASGAVCSLVYSTSCCTKMHLTRGGDERDRTADPLLARQVLSQLSYTPMSAKCLYIISFSAKCVNYLYKVFQKKFKDFSEDFIQKE